MTARGTFLVVADPEYDEAIGDAVAKVDHYRFARVSG